MTKDANPFFSLGKSSLRSVEKALEQQIVAADARILRAVKRTLLSAKDPTEIMLSLARLAGEAEGMDKLRQLIYAAETGGNDD